MAPAKRTTADTLGKRITQARLSAGAERGRAFTQTELARVLGVTPPTVSQWESGSEPNLATIRRIATALGVSPAYLAFGAPYPIVDPAHWDVGQAPQPVEPDPTLDRRLTDQELDNADALTAPPLPRRRKRGEDE